MSKSMVDLRKDFQDFGQALLHQDFGNDEFEIKNFEIENFEIENFDMNNFEIEKPILLWLLKS